MSNIKFPFSISILFIWIGFVASISFMEAWLKFQAPGITLPLGLGIGRLIFGALNIMEWVFFILILLNYLLKKSVKYKSYVIFLAISAIVLILQTVWLLPVLDERAQQIIDGKIVEPAKHHVVYIISEFLKLISLIIFGKKLFGQTKE